MVKTKFALKREVDSKRREISSDNLSMSVGELLNLYKDRELDIHPEFQRVFRWDTEQKSRLIESLLLGIPLPPIYVASNEKGVWEVIDGVQRLSTIFEFMGELCGPESESSSDELVPKPALVLEATKHLPALEDATFEKLDPTLRLEFKRTRLDVKILEREEGTSSSGKFDLFERLNTYGVVLSPQELRNCVLVSLNSDLYKRLKKLAEDKDFRESTLLSDAQLLERYDMDLALRFITLRGVDPKGIGDVHEFLRDRMEAIAQDPSFDVAREEKLFKDVFSHFNNILGGDSFRPWNQTQKEFRGGFSLGAFEGIALSVGKHWSQIKRLPNFDLRSLVLSVWNTAAYRKSFSGLRARERMARVVPVAEKAVKEAIAKAKISTARRKTRPTKSAA